MTQQLTPPPELVAQWRREWYRSSRWHSEWQPYLATRAAQWGARQELEACCEWLEHKVLLQHQHDVVPSLRAARRPKLLTLKEEALADLDTMTTVPPGMSPLSFETTERISRIRRALKSIPDPS